MNDRATRRVFFALWPEAGAASHLAVLAQELAAGSGRVMHPACLHLTLAFVGTVTSAQVAQLERIAAGIRAKAFALSLDRLGFWPQRGILWAGCRRASAPLRGLAEILAADLRSAGFSIDHRPGAGFVPHVTLARGARCLALPRLATPIRWPVGGFVLVESRLRPAPANYQTLACFALDETDTAVD